MTAYQQAVLLLTDYDPKWLWQECIESLAVCFDEEGTTDHGVKLRELYAAGRDVKGFIQRTKKRLVAMIPTEGKSVDDIANEAMKALGHLFKTDDKSSEDH